MSLMTTTEAPEEEECYAPPMDIRFYWKFLLILLYGSVGVASLFGNICVVLVVVMRKEMQTVTNIFISSVSAAALVITGFSLWATPLAKYSQVWLLGETMCYLVASIQGASLIWVPFTLAVIAIDRYLMVASPFRHQMSVRTCLLIIFGIWLSAFAVLTPAIANLHYIELPSCHTYCVENWRPNNNYRLLYGVCVLLIRSGIPLAVIAWCNWRIASIVNNQGTKFQRSTLSNNTAENNRKQRLHTTLKAMVIIFAVSSFPLDLFNVLQDMDTAVGLPAFMEMSPTLIDFTFFSSHWIAMTGNLLNPLVYAWWNENFRRQIQQIVAEFRGIETRRGVYSVVVTRTSRKGKVCTSVMSDVPKGGPHSTNDFEGDVQV